MTRRVRRAEADEIARWGRLRRSLSGGCADTGRWGVLSRLALAVILLAALWAPSAPAADAASTADQPRVLPQLLDEAGKQPDKIFRVIVQRKSRNRAADAHLSGRGTKKLRDLEDVRADPFLAEGSRSRLLAPAEPIRD